jgi:hypothetical protein
MIDNELKELSKECYKVLIGVSNTIRILNVDYTIEYKKLEEYHGLCYYQLRCIIISPTFNDRLELLDTIIHESLHAYYFEKGNQKFLDEEFIDTQTKKLLKELGYETKTIII